MKRFSILVIALVVTLCCGMALAQAKAVEHALLFGKVEVKTMNNAKEVTLTVTNAMSHHVKDIEALKGKTLKVVGPKLAEVEKFAGKEVEAAGILQENRTQFEATFVLEKNPAQVPAALHVFIIGKAEVQTANNAKTVSIAIEDAKGYGAKEMAALKGKALTVMGPKAPEVEKLAGKEIEATGVLKENDTQIEVTFVMEKKVAPAHQAPAPKKK